MIKDNRAFFLRYLFIMFSFISSGCSDTTATPLITPSQTVSLEETSTSIAVSDVENELILLGMTENLTTKPEFFGAYNNIIFSSTIDGQQPRILELLEMGKVEHISSAGNGELVLSTVYRIITSAAPVYFGENLGKLYLHHSAFGWSRLLTDRLWGPAFFLPDHKGIVYGVLDENLKPVFYLVDERGQNSRKLIELDDLGFLLSSYNSKYIFYKTQEELIDEGIKTHVWRFSIEDGTIVNITFCSPENSGWVSISQNYYACISIEDETVYIFDLDGRLLIKKTWKDISRMDWSPDETRLLIETLSHENEEYFYITFVWDIGSDNIILLPVDGAVGDFSGRNISAFNNEFWSPDGNKVLVWYDDPFIVDVNTLEVNLVESPLQDVSIHGVYWLR